VISTTYSCPLLHLKPGKENILLQRHPWIFSGALERFDQITHGAICQLTTETGEIVATGTFSNRGGIAFRVFDWSPVSLDTEWMQQKIKLAHRRRELLGLAGEIDSPNKSGYRIVHAEADSLPGIIIDRYADTLVFQLSTAGADGLRQTILDALQSLFLQCNIVERSDSHSRTSEGLPANCTSHVNKSIDADLTSVQFEQDGMRFLAHPLTGQKTGFYLDQRDLRVALRKLSHGRRVLNLFSYTGTLGLAAALGGASSVHHVDASDESLECVRKHWELNECETAFSIETADIFQWLGQTHHETFDMVILDPPALIKSQKDAESGQRGYHFLNRAAMRLLSPGGILVSSSCSQYFSQDDLMTTIRRSAIQNQREADLLAVVHQSGDHPRSLYFSESDYLCSLVCVVR
jgi:23S rRNA (cytosine1962-C5)-methyltransferase